MLAVNEEVSRKTGLYKEELIGRQVCESNTAYLTYLPLEKAAYDNQPVKYAVPQPDGSRTIMETRVTSGSWNGKSAFFCLCRDVTS
ncbi:MAG TPA: PAS domain S-box protein, partial [Methanospirillum sp.]|nr:PAS domain S-box protein [Methanospirillum sp.]